MADATPTNGETGTPPAPKTEPKAPSTPAPAPQPEPVKTEDNAVEELRKQLLHQEQRANQLANQLKSKEEAEAKAKEKELEEQNQFKDLYEQEKAKLEAIEAEREKAEQEAELKKLRDEALADYSDDVKALATDVGLDLAAPDEDSVKQFKEKLDKLNTRVQNNGKVGPNNRQEVPKGNDLSPEEIRKLNQDQTGKAWHDYVTSNFPGIAAMTTPKRSE